MPILLDRYLQEQIPQDPGALPVAFYRAELAALPGRAGPVHWHPFLELATARQGVLDCQVGQTHITLAPGDSILINQNRLHSFRQLSGGEPDPLPILVFSGTVIAPEDSAAYQKYVRPVLGCSGLPFVVFRGGDARWAGLGLRLRAACRAMAEQSPYYELEVQRSLSALWQILLEHWDALPRAETSPVQLNAQIRLQKMLAYLYSHYDQNITLADIAGAAHISRSEAGRCFRAYLGCSPVEALIRYRLQAARRLLGQTTLTLQQISDACGFHSANYFSRQFRKRYGHSPGENRRLGK